MTNLYGKVNIQYEFFNLIIPSEMLVNVIFWQTPTELADPGTEARSILDEATGAGAVAGAVLSH